MIGPEICNAIFAADDISQLTHIIGGALGLIFGLTMRREEDKERCREIEWKLFSADEIIKLITSKQF